MSRHAKRPRDQRLDLFRGLTMLIIFVAHVPDNPWMFWIPARFGFSSGTELFVFCSGVASALAFGSIFVARGLVLGTARIAFRCWQVYWAHMGLFMASVALAAGIDRLTGTTEVLATQFGPLLTDPAGAMLAVATLGWLPPYLDILPMYLVILALVPVMMALRRLHAVLPFCLVAALYLAAWLGGLQLQGEPWQQFAWFLNPFGWQLVFFLGFFFAMGWIPVPPLRRPALVWTAVALLVACVPVAFWGIYEQVPAVEALRSVLLPINEKADLHILRVLHFLVLAYVVLSLVDPYRMRLDATAPGRMLVMIGRQSLGTFMASLIVARVAGVALDLVGRSAGPVALVNLAGLACVVLAAMVVGWFKSAPWSAPRAARTEAPEPVRPEQSETGADPFSDRSMTSPLSKTLQA